MAGNPNRLDLAAPSAFAREPGKERNLQGTDHFGPVDGHRQQLIGIGVDGVESIDIALRQRQGSVLAAGAKRIVGQHGDDVRQVLGLRSAKDDHGVEISRGTGGRKI